MQPREKWQRSNILSLTDLVSLFSSDAWIPCYLPPFGWSSDIQGFSSTRRRETVQWLTTSYCRSVHARTRSLLPVAEPLVPPRSIREPPLARVAEIRFTTNDSRIPPAGVLLLTPNRKITNLEKSSTNSLLYLKPRGDASGTNETRTIPLTRPLDDELYQLILGVEVRILVQKGASEIRTIRTHRGRALDSINPDWTRSFVPLLAHPFRESVIEVLKGCSKGLFGNMTGKREATTRRGCRHSTTGRPAELPSLLSPRISCLLFLFHSRARSLFPSLSLLPSPPPCTPLSPIRRSIELLYMRFVSSFSNSIFRHLLASPNFPWLFDFPRDVTLLAVSNVSVVVTWNVLKVICVEIGVVPMLKSFYRLESFVSNVSRFMKSNLTLGHRYIVFGNVLRCASFLLTSSFSNNIVAMLFVIIFSTSHLISNHIYLTLSISKIKMKCIKVKFLSNNSFQGLTRFTTQNNISLSFYVNSPDNNANPL